MVTFPRGSIKAGALALSCLATCLPCSSLKLALLSPVMSSITKEKLSPTYDAKVVDVSSEEEQQAPTIPDPQRLAEEKALVWKLDKRILPFACLLYLFACKYSACWS